MGFTEQLSAALAELERRGCRRHLCETVPGEQGFILCGGKKMVNLSGNDYLGLGSNGSLRECFWNFFGKDRRSRELALTSSSSRLLTGSSPACTRLEETLSRWYGGRAALVFNSGWHANTGILPALAGKRDLILADKLVHASLIDGMRLAESEFFRYRHLDMDHLEALLNDRRDKYDRVFIVTESVFSMDGDEANLRKLAELKKRFDGILVVDEAHAVGVRGPEGQGLAAEAGVLDEIDVLVGTFGKALGSTGAYAITAAETKDFLINKMRSFIFTTALPPVILNWSCFAVEQAKTMTSERAKLRRMGVKLREIFRKIDEERTIPGVSQIVPWITGGEEAAAALAAHWREKGYLVFPIRVPTVPRGQARLRISLSAALPEETVEKLGGLL